MRCGCSYPPPLLTTSFTETQMTYWRGQGLSRRSEHLLLCRLLGVPLLPLRWQLRLGVQRPQRPPPQITHLEQALLDVTPEQAPEGVPPSVQQQWRDDQELQEQHPEPVQASEGQQLQPGGQQDEVAQVSAAAELLSYAHHLDCWDRQRWNFGRTSHACSLPNLSSWLDLATGRG